MYVRYNFETEQHRHSIYTAMIDRINKLQMRMPSEREARTTNKTHRNLLQTREYHAIHHREKVLLKCLDLCCFSTMLTKRECIAKESLMSSATRLSNCSEGSLRRQLVSFEDRFLRLFFFCLSSRRALRRSLSCPLFFSGDLWSMISSLGLTS